MDAERDDFRLDFACEFESLPVAATPPGGPIHWPQGFYVMNESTTLDRSPLLRSIRIIFTPALVPVLIFVFGIGTSQAASATWNLNPTSGDWNTAANWSPATVPNGPADTATFNLSNGTAVSVMQDTEVNGIVFNPGASSFTITSIDAETNGASVFTISGTGVTNNSGVVQNFATAISGDQGIGFIEFTNNASGGSRTLYNISRGTTIDFRDSSTAGSASFINKGLLHFWDNSTAAESTITNRDEVIFDSSAGNARLINFGAVVVAGTAADAAVVTRSARNGGVSPPYVLFLGTGSAGGGHFTLQGGTVSEAQGGNVTFGDISTAANATFTVEGGAASGALGGLVDFTGPITFGSFGGASAANCTINVNGGQVAGAKGGVVAFDSFERGGSLNSTAGNSILIATGGAAGAEGGSIVISGNAKGGAVRVEIFDNATLDVSLRLTKPFVTIGSLEGSGSVFLGSTTLRVGNNNVNTIFSGVIQEAGGMGTGTGGSLTKLGHGTLTLSGANTYTGGTVVRAGSLIAGNSVGSATGMDR